MKFSDKKNVFVFIVLLLMAVIFAFLLQNYLFVENKSNEEAFPKHTYSQDYTSGVIPHYSVAKSIIEKFSLSYPKKTIPKKLFCSALIISTSRQFTEIN